MINVQVLSPRARSADAVLHMLAGAHRSAWGEFVRSGANDASATEDCEALARALAICPARTREGLAAKASVIRARIVTGSVLDLLDAGDDNDMRLVASYVDDALALSGE
jgi:hypothetical protein